MIEKDIEIDKKKNYIKTSKGIIGPLEAYEVISYIEQGLVQDTDEIFLPAQNTWKQLSDISDLHVLKPEHIIEFQYPDLIDSENPIGEKNLYQSITKYQHLKKIQRYRRIQISLPLRYRKKGAFSSKGKDFKKASTVDLSVSGISFEIYGTAFTTDSILEIEIDIPGFTESITGTVKVVRISKSFQDKYIIGARFIEVKDEFKKMLVKFIREEIVRRVFLVK